MFDSICGIRACTDLMERCAFKKLQMNCSTQIVFKKILCFLKFTFSYFAVIFSLKDLFLLTEKTLPMT